MLSSVNDHRFVQSQGETFRLFNKADSNVSSKIQNLQNNIFNKNIQLRDLPEKYGAEGCGLIAFEDIQEGEVLWSRIGDDKSWFTRDQLSQLMKDRPSIAQKIIDFSCQNGEDLFTLPTACLTGEEIDPRQYINHSCDPNCGYRTDPDGKTYTVALRKISAGEELTKDYGTLETEASFTYGLNCNCGSKNCTGTWKFDLYRRTDSEAEKRLAVSKPELRRKAESMRTEFWHGPTSRLRRIPSSRPIEDRELILCALQDLKKGEEVAHFINGKIKYVLVDHENANCDLVNGQLIANRDIAAGTDFSIAKNVNVYCDGVFDLFHRGHMNHIRNASEYGTRILVGVVSDENVKSYKREPVMTMEERMETVKTFGVANQVIPDAPMVIDQQFLDAWNIHVVCISPEYSSDDDNYYALPRRLGILRVMERTPGISTTDLIGRIKNEN